MDKGRHPKVIRTWLAGKIRKHASKARNRTTIPRKRQLHNKT